MAFQIPFGVAQAATIRVGMAYGARDAGWIGRAGNVALAVGIGVMALTATAIWIAPRAFVGLYIDADAPGECGGRRAGAEISGHRRRVPVARRRTGGRGGGAARPAGYARADDVALVGYWGVGFGTAILFAFHLGWGGQGVWLGLAAGLFAVSALLLWRWTLRSRIGLLPA